MQRILPQQHLISPATRLFSPPSDLLGEVQATLAAIADLDCCYAMDQERGALNSSADAAQSSLGVERERRHRQQRDYYVQRLNELERRMLALRGW